MYDASGLAKLIYWSALALYIGTAGGALYLALKRPRSALRKATAAVAVLAIFSVLPAIYAKEALEKKKAQEEFAKYRDAAWAHFQKRCKENAGEKIYRTVENVEGMFLSKPRERPTEDQLRNQFWMGDPYGLDSYGKAEIGDYLYHLDDKGYVTTVLTAQPGFDFVETPANDGKSFLRYVRDQEKKSVTAVAVQSRQSRYEVRWQDVSTSEDRGYWVAGGRLQVVDALSNEVLGERRGYMIEGGFGATSGGRRPWLHARLIGGRTACPPIRTNVPMNRLFVETVLKPKRGN